VARFFPEEREAEAVAEYREVFTVRRRE